MATKILNIEHDDDFDDVLEFIKKDGDEFVLVVPKSHRAFRDAYSFDLLKKETDKLGKSVTVVSNDENILENAAAVNFQTVGKKKKHKVDTPVPEEQKTSALVMHQPEENETPQKTKEEDKPPDINTDRIVGRNYDPGIELDVKSMDEDEKNIEIHDLNTQRHNKEKSSEISDFYSKSAKRLEKLTVPRENLNRPPRREFKKFTIILTVAGSVAAIFLITTLLSKAKINIQAQKERFVLEAQITISENIKELDVNRGLVPGKMVEIERVLSDNFQSTGENTVETKTNGKITVFNEFSSSPQVLVATTRFETPDGLIFRTPKTITVPGAKLESGELIAGKIEIEVIADAAGENYNIGPGDFTIPGFKGSAKFEKFYAKSSEVFTGGFKGISTVATEEDVKQAESGLTDKMGEFLKSEMEKLILDDTVTFSPELLNTDISFSDKSSKAGQAGEKFTIITYGKASTMFFKKDDIKKLLEERIKTENPSLTLKKEVDINYQDLVFSAENNTVSGKLSASGNAYYNLNKESILADISGLNGNGVKEYFSQKKEIEFTKVIISPFWKNSIPEDKDRIELEITYE